MNRNKAKLLTLAGIDCCLVSVILLIGGLVVKINVSLLIVALFFVVGVISIVFSLAYYTEK